MAFAWLDKAIEKNEDGLYQQLNQPVFKPLHADPRWMDFRERTFTSDEQISAIEFSVVLPGQSKQ